jgi:hypothetical protein
VLPVLLVLTLVGCTKQGSEVHGPTAGPRCSAHRGARLRRRGVGGDAARGNANATGEADGTTDDAVAVDVDDWDDTDWDDDGEGGGGGYRPDTARGRQLAGGLQRLAECYGSRYNRWAEYGGGPAPRGLDRFAVAIEDGRVIVGTSAIIEGPSRQTNVLDQPPEGPSCLGG